MVSKDIFSTKIDLAKSKINSAFWDVSRISTYSSCILHALSSRTSASLDFHFLHKVCFFRLTNSRRHESSRNQEFVYAVYDSILRYHFVHYNSGSNPVPSQSYVNCGSSWYRESKWTGQVLMTISSIFHLVVAVKTLKIKQQSLSEYIIQIIYKKEELFFYSV